MRLIDKNISYLIIQPSTRLFTATSVERELASGTTYTEVDLNGRKGIPIFIPIPLNSLFSSVNRFLGFQETGHIKSQNVYTSDASNVINSLSRTEANIKLTTSNSTSTYMTKGSGDFQLQILVSVNNIFELLFEGYMEYAMRLLFNTRFHYLSNTTLCFNMLLSNYHKDRTNGSNSRYTLIFTRPERGVVTTANNPNKKVTSGLPIGD